MQTFSQHRTLSVGWDIGGAHVKTVVLDEQGQALQVEQLFCPLWKGVAALEEAITQVLASLAHFSAEFQHAITMTGELVDSFASREHGVITIADVMCTRLGPAVRFFALSETPKKYTWLAHSEVADAWGQIASANWAASACYLATCLPEAIVVDIGSSTTDIIPIQQHRLHALGYTDAARMACGELLYTGVVRTPVMAISPRIPFAGEWVNVAAEYFATSADVYRLTGELPPAFDMADTADGQDKSLWASARRLARMIGRDVEEASLRAWQQVAWHIRVLHQAMIAHELLRVGSRLTPTEEASTNKDAHPNTITGVPIVAMGAGAFLVNDMARQWQITCVDAEHFVRSHDKSLKQHAQVCFPAYAVAALSFDDGVFD